MDGTDDTTEGDALVEIHHEGGDDSLKLVGDLMARNARDAAWATERAYEGEKLTVSRLEAENALLRQRLYTIEERVMWLLGVDTDEEV